jgi:hypothetical protein
MAKKDAYSGMIEKGLINPPPTISGQNIARGPKGRVVVESMKNGPQKGDIIHGVNKYRDENLHIEDNDYTYKKSSRGGWTVTGTK